MDHHKRESAGDSVGVRVAHGACMKTRHCRARPRRPGKPQAANLTIRCHRDEIAGWRRCAAQMGLTLADYVRQQMSAQARKQKKEIAK